MIHIILGFHVIFQCVFSRSKNLGFFVLVGHLLLEVLEEASFLGSAELVNFVDIGLVVTKVGLLAAIASSVSLLNEASAADVSISGGSGFFDDGSSTLSEALVVDVALVESLGGVDVTLVKA